MKLKGFLEKEKNGNQAQPMQFRNTNIIRQETSGCETE
jgi:hypothetical protein